MEKIEPNGSKLKANTIFDKILENFAKQIELAEDSPTRNKVITERQDFLIELVDRLIIWCEEDHLKSSLSEAKLKLQSLDISTIQT